MSVPKTNSGGNANGRWYYLPRSLRRAWAWTLRLFKFPRRSWASRSWWPGNFFSPGTRFPSGLGFRFLAMVNPIINPYWFSMVGHPPRPVNTRQSRPRHACQ